jgi:signal transduction histidine kinase
MRPRARSVKSLLTRNLLLSVGLCFAATVLVAVLFGFDLEDQIFENQASSVADRVIGGQESPAPTGANTISGIEMQYYDRFDALPAPLVKGIDPTWTDGEYEVTVDSDTHFHVAIRSVDGEPHYITFNARPYVRSTQQVLQFIAIVAVLGGVMLVIALIFLGRLAKRVSGPLEAMAQAASGECPAASGPSETDNPPEEIVLLAASLAARDERIEELIERERQFNRNVSHELRTPLSIAMGAAELLEDAGERTPVTDRLGSALGNMRLLTEGILWLGRQPDEDATCNVWQSCEQAAKINRHLLNDDEVAFGIVGDRGSRMPVPDAVAQVIIGNLVRNAFTFTNQGEVSVRISESDVCVRDTGVGFGEPSDVGGFGIGLSLAERLCAHFGLAISVGPGEETGTIARVSW